MATLTITTTGGTTHTYPGLELESAQHETQVLKKAHYERKWWRSPNSTTVEEFVPESIVSVNLSVDEE